MMWPAYKPQRRLLLVAGGGLLMSAALAHRASAADEVEIVMSGTTTGSEVWFRPRGVLIQPGQTVRWINKDAGNVHTSTAYHPGNGKPLRMPQGAKAWDSDYIMPDESFAVKFTVPGVYDYFCKPHEQAGMVGRIVVGQIDVAASPYSSTDGLLPAQALGHFPSVADILAQGRVS